MAFDLSILEKIPAKPGVYIMKGSEGAILYVGKAKNLRVRTRQYFTPGRDGRYSIPFLVSKVLDIETIVVASDKEALLLENTLIKTHKPRYNVLLKDDKTYLALKITTNQEWPMIQVVRYKGTPKKEGTFFGPYTSAQAARKSIDLLNRLFPLRQCSDQEFVRRTRPCILYGMKRCLAPCVKFCTHEEYQKNVDRTIDFLKGRDDEILRELTQEMEEKSKNLEFEEADRILKTIRYIKATLENQSVDKPFGGDSDVFGLYREGSEVSISQMLFRSGKLTGGRSFQFRDTIQESDELLTSLLLQLYENGVEIPKEILLPIFLEDKASLESILSEQKGFKVRLHRPQKGEGKTRIKMAEDNAVAIFKKERDEKGVKEKILFEMQEKFHLTKFPRQVVCFDTSNLQGSNYVASMVVFQDGMQAKKSYRRYALKITSSPDDYAAFYEVLNRALGRFKNENNLPDLVIVDGGKGHLNIALKVLRELDIVVVNLIAMAKEEARHDKGSTEEKIFLPEVKDPVILKKNSSLLFLLQQIRDEAHRFAITYHRKKRAQNTMKSSLERIKGIGPKKRIALLKTFGSVKKIQEATEEMLLNVAGITKNDVKAIKEFYILNPS